MWECPDLFPLGDQHILICCPQGLAREKSAFSTPIRRCGWRRFDYERAAFDHGELHELDAGFEFYAPQTMLASDGRRLLVGWMGVPDGEEMLQPTRRNGWIHQMTCLRELEFIDGQLYQRPLRELTALRGEAHGWQGSALPLAPMELALKRPRRRWGSILAARPERDGGIRLARRSLASDEMHYRYWRGEAARCGFLSTERGNFHQRRRRGDEQPLLPGLSGAAIFSVDAGCILLLAAATMHGRISVLLSGSWRRDENQTRNH
jgi:beta-fructofuranosidase